MKSTESERGWPLQLIGVFERPSSKLSVPISVLGIVIFIALGLIGILALGWLIADFLSGDQKSATEAAKATLPVLAAAIGLPLIIWRLLILDRQTRISEEKTQIDRETHYTSIFSRSIEQLGQTREIKKTVTDKEQAIDTTTTVPNIEVRLGGIHSLSRLAEESVRDREKIGNVLRSYIRENSWSDRKGSTAEKPEWQASATWMLDFLQLAHTDANAKKAKDDWRVSFEKRFLELSTWAKIIPETRVDVNEATDALLVATEHPKSKQLLYECLFVGTQFSPELLAIVFFRRCTFIRCSFHVEGTSLSIEDSILIETQFSTVDSEISITDSRLNDVWFKTQGIVRLTDCESHSVRIAGNPSIINLIDTIACRLRIIGRRDKERPATALNLAGAAVLFSTIQNLTLSADSELQDATGISDLTLRRSDFGAVANIDPGILNRIQADSETIHPLNFDRPSAWAPARQVRSVEPE